jgi:hypothetical protein
LDLAQVVSVAADSRLVIPLVIREIHRESLVFSFCHSSLVISQLNNSFKSKERASATTLLDGFDAAVVVKGKCQGLMFSNFVSSYSLSDHKGSFVPFSGH